MNYNFPEGSNNHNNSYELPIINQFSNLNETSFHLPTYSSRLITDNNTRRSQTNEQRDIEPNELIYKPLFSNREQTMLYNFLFKTCSPYVENTNYDFLSKLHQLIPKSDAFWFCVLTQNMPNLKIKEVQKLPYYKGSALGITTMSSKKRKDLFKGKTYDQHQLHWKLLKLFFTYFNPFFFVVHPSLFFRKMLSSDNDPSFRFLLLVVLSLATGYLHIEPYPGSPDPSELCESYLNEALELFEELKHKPSINTLQAVILLCNSNYSKINTSLSEAWIIGNQLGFPAFFNKSSHEILSTMPVYPHGEPPSDQYLEWEQSLIVWCFLVFKCILSSLAGMPIAIPIQSELLDITNITDVLFYEDRLKCFADKGELEILKHIYRLDPIALAILRTKHNLSQPSQSRNIDVNLHQKELNAIISKFKRWEFYLNSSLRNMVLNTRINTLISTAFRYRHFLTLFLTTPYLEVLQASNTHSIQNHFMLDDSIFSELLSSCVSMILSSWAEGDVFSLMGSGVRNYMLFVAWACAQSIYKLIDQVIHNIKSIQESSQRSNSTPFQSNPMTLNEFSDDSIQSNPDDLDKKLKEYEFLKQLCTVLIPLPLKTLLKSIPVCFHHRPIDLLLEQQSAHFWCMINPQHKSMLSSYVTITEMRYRKDN